MYDLVLLTTVCETTLWYAIISDVGLRLSNFGLSFL